MRNNSIAFIIPSLNSGGAERVVSNLANNLVQTYEVHIITLSKTVPFYSLNKNITLHYCLAEIIPSRTIISAIKNNWILTKSIIEISRKNNLQLLIGFMTTTNILSIISGKILHIPVIISERNNPFMETTPKIWKILRRFLYRFSNMLVVQTEPIKQYYKYSVPKNKLVIIPNPVFMDVVPNKEKKRKEKENIIVNVGRLSAQKAQDILIKAFAKTQNDNWNLIIAGEGENREQLENLVQELGLQNKVNLVGLVREIPLIYLKAEIFAFSSIYEGFPNALIEAMYFGLPCISTDCPTGPSELINDGVNGFLSPVNDIDTFAHKLNLLMQDETLRKEFGGKSQSSVTQFDAKNVTDCWKELIKKCIQK